MAHDLRRGQISEPMAIAPPHISAIVAQPWTFLDRDGVINVDKGYVGTWERFTFLPRAIDALRSIATKGYALAIVSNQAGIARGLYDECDYVDLTYRMIASLRRSGVYITVVAHCPHHPTAARVAYFDRRCRCRKPAGGLLRDIASTHPVAFERSFMIGDKQSDIDAGRNAGIPLANRVLCTPHYDLLTIARSLPSCLDNDASELLASDLLPRLRSGNPTCLMGDFMQKKKVDELIIELNDIDVGAVSGGAVMGGSAVTMANWNKTMLLGCCTQGCCGDEASMVG